MVKCLFKSEHFLYTFKACECGMIMFIQTCTQSCSSILYLGPEANKYIIPLAEELVKTCLTTFLHTTKNDFCILSLKIRFPAKCVKLQHTTKLPSPKLDCTCYGLFVLCILTADQQFLHVLIHLIQGSALYWWNLKKSGEGDYSTRHAGCPVLVGSKWGNLFFSAIIMFTCS